MKLSVVLVVVWAMSLVVTAGIGYKVGTTVVICPAAPESAPPIRGMQYAPHNNSPSKGY